MYDDLILRLRELSEEQFFDFERKPYLQAADAIEKLLQETQQLPRWIPVTERLPRDRQFVLVYCGDNKRIRPSDRFDVAILLGDSIFTSLGVTHWMPLPEPPKEE